MRTLLLDYGGVLCGPHGPAEQAEIATILGGASKEPLESAYWEHRADYDRGVLTAAGYWQRVARRLGTPLREGALPRLLAADAAGWGHLDQDVVDWAAQVAERTPTWLLSNMPREVKDPLVPRIEAAVAFRGLLFSCDLAVVKPDKEAYRSAARRMETDPADIVMVDDRIVNVDGAQRAGMRAVLFTTAAESIPAIEHALTA